MQDTFSQTASDEWSLRTGKGQSMGGGDGKGQRWRSSLDVLPGKEAVRPHRNVNAEPAFRMLFCNSA